MMPGRNDETDGIAPAIRITDKREPSKFWTNTRAFLKGAAKEGGKVMFPWYGAWEGIKSGYGSVMNWFGAASRLVEGQGGWRDVAVAVGFEEAPAVVDLATGIYNGDEAAYEALGGVVWNVAAGAAVGSMSGKTSTTASGGGAVSVSRAVNAGKSFFYDRHGYLTDGKYKVNLEDLKPHIYQYKSGKSIFYPTVNASEAALKAAAYADELGLWKGATAKVNVTNTNIGTLSNGRPTNVINVYRDANNFIHASPGNNR